MEEGYRLPTIDEFIQGFEFEYSSEHRWGMIYFHEDGTSSMKQGEPYIIWHKAKVHWKQTDWVTEEYSDGQTVTMSPETYNLLSEPFNIQSWLDQGLIRVKIK